jgi:hypothetical protein
VPNSGAVHAFLPAVDLWFDIPRRAVANPGHADIPGMRGADIGGMCLSVVLDNDHDPNFSQWSFPVIIASCGQLGY